MASTPSKSTPAKAAAASTTAAEETQKPSAAETQSGNPNNAPPPPAPSSDPVGEEAQRRAEEARFQQTPDAQRDPADEEPERQKRSTKTLEAGDNLLYRHPTAGPVFALVTDAPVEGEAEVLLLRDSEVVRARTVVVYASAEDAERGFNEGQEHVAWHH